MHTMRRRTKWIFLGLAVAALGGGFAYSRMVWDYPWASWDLDAAVRDYRALGLPWEAKDLEPVPPIKPEENAAPLLLTAYLPLSRETKAGRELTDRISAATRGNIAQAREAVAASDDVLNRLETALKRPRLWLKRDWDEGEGLLMSQISYAVTSAKLLGLRVRTRLADADPSGALDDVARMFRLARLVAQEPTLYPLTASVAIEFYAFRSLEQVMDFGGRKPRLLERALAITPAPDPDRYARAMRGEGFLRIATLRNLNRLGGADSFVAFSEGGETRDPYGEDQPLRRSGVPEEMKDRALMTRHLQLFTTMFRGWQPGRGDAFAMRAFVAELGQVNRPGASYALARHYLFFMKWITVANGDARRVTARAMLQVLQYRSRENRWPRDLAEAGVTALDPFSQKPLRYRVEGGQAMVYSVGVDAVDNGGSFADPAAPAGSGDGADIGTVFPSTVRSGTR